MGDQIVTVGDQEVKITETEDGFEAEPVEDEPDSGVYLRAKSDETNPCGFEIPIDGDYVIEPRDGSTLYKYNANWDTDQDISDMHSNGSHQAEDIGPHDGHGAVDTLEIVEY